MDNVAYIVSPVTQELMDEVRVAKDICIAERIAMIKNQPGTMQTESWEWSHKYYINREFIWDMIRRNFNKQLTEYSWKCLFEINPGNNHIVWKEMVSTIPDNTEVAEVVKT